MDREKAIAVLMAQMLVLGKGFPAYREAMETAIAALREQELKWISVEERLPDAAQGMEGVLGFVNGYNGRITFTDAYLFVKYDYAENAWWSEDYDIEGCKVTHWMPLPEPPEV